MIVQRQCYTKLLGQMQMWAKDTVKRLVISGTPGIGKTTLIYFLLWKFFQKELDYDGRVGHAVGADFHSKGWKMPEPSNRTPADVAKVFGFV